MYIQTELVSVIDNTTSTLVVFLDLPLTTKVGDKVTLKNDERLWTITKKGITYSREQLNTLRAAQHTTN